MLQYRNTPDRYTKLSPAMSIFGHTIRDFIPILPGKYKPHKTWRETQTAREDALRKRHMKLAERLLEHTKRLPPLVVGDFVRTQNQVGPHPLKWDKTGVVIEVRQFDQYVVKVDGSGRVTMRNRKFLRKFIPVHSPARMRAFVTNTTHIHHQPKPCTEINPPVEIAITPNSEARSTETLPQSQSSTPDVVQVPEFPQTTRADPSHAQSPVQTGIHSNPDLHHLNFSDPRHFVREKQPNTLRPSQPTAMQNPNNPLPERDACNTPRRPKRAIKKTSLAPGL